MSGFISIEQANAFLYRFMGGEIEDGIITKHAKNYPKNYEGNKAASFIHYHKSWDAVMPVFHTIRKKYNVTFVITPSRVTINHTGLRMHTESLNLIAFSVIIRYLIEEQHIAVDRLTYEEKYV